MSRPLSKRERLILCHPVVCKHLADYWDMYGLIVEIASVMRQLPLVTHAEIENLVKIHLNNTILYTHLKTLPNVIPVRVGATFEGLYLLFVWLFMSLNSYKKAPNNSPGGGKTCPT